MTTTPAPADLLPVGTFARITDDEHGHAGRVGEIVHNSDNGWYRLRIDNGVAVLYRRHQIEAAPRAEGLPGKRDILAGKVRGLTQLLDGVDADYTEVLDGLRGAIDAELAAIDSELAAPAPAAPAWVYVLHVGAYDARTLLGIFTTLDRVERAIVGRVFCGDELHDIDVTVEGLDGAEVPEVVRTHLDAWVAERSRGAR